MYKSFLIKYAEIAIKGKLLSALRMHWYRISDIILSV